MRMFKYARRLLLKEWVPVISVFLIVSVLTAIIAVASHDYYDMLSFEVATFTWPSAIFSLVMPFFVFSYRFTKVGGDTYYQLPFAEKQFKNLRVLTGLFAVLFVFIVTFIIGYSAFAITYAVKPETVVVFYGGSQRLFEKVIINPLYMLLAFPSFILILAGMYFVTSAFVSLTTRLPTAIFLTIVGQTVLFATVLSFSAYIEYFFVNSSFWIQLESASLYINPSFIGGNLFIGNFGYGSAFGSDSLNTNLFDGIARNAAEGDYSTLIIVIVLSIITISIYGGATALTMLGSEPSGEHNGVGGSTNKYVDFAIYFMTIVAGFATASTAYSVWYLYAFLLVVYVAGLYILMSIYLGTFKVGVAHGLFIGSSALYLIVFPIITGVTASFGFVI